MMRAILSFFLAFLFVMPAQADEAGARKFAEVTANKAVTVLASSKAEGDKLKQLEKLFVDSVDTDWIGKFVLGKHWKDMTDAQQKDYLKNYKAFLVKHYTANFKEYAQGTTFAVTRSKPMGKDQFMVSMDINRPGQQPVKVDYRMRQQGAGFGIIDIVVEGVSLLNTQRSEFASVVQRDGIEKLIEQLKAKT